MTWIKDDRYFKQGFIEEDKTIGLQKHWKTEKKEF